MATLRGSVFKRSRRLGFSILETGKEFAKGKGRQTVPGQHGNKRRPKLSDYGLHLYEKQKIRFMVLQKNNLKIHLLKQQKDQVKQGLIFYKC